MSLRLTLMARAVALVQQGFASQAVAMIVGAAAGVAGCRVACMVRSDRQWLLICEAGIDGVASTPSVPRPVTVVGDFDTRCLARCTEIGGLCMPFVVDGRAIALLHVADERLDEARTQTLEALEAPMLLALLARSNAALHGAIARGNEDRKAADDEARRTEYALRESEAQFRRMAESTHDVIWITELEPERVVYVSPSFERLWGYTVAQLYEDPHLWVHGIHPEDRERVGASFGAWIADLSAAPWVQEFRVLQPNGQVRWILDRGAKSMAGGTMRVSGISTDITARRHAEEALAASEQRFSLAMDAARDGHWDWTAATDVFYASDRMLEIYGFPPGHRFSGRDDFLRQFPFEPGERERWHGQFSACLRGRQAHFEITLGLRRAGETAYVHLHGMLTRDAAGRPVRWTGSVRDVTEQRAREAALRQAQRLEAVGTLASGIAHDFNNILGAILGYVELGTSDTRAGSRARRDMGLIGHAAERGRALVERIVAFSRSGGTPSVAVDIDAVVADALQLLSATLPAAIRVETAFETGSATVLCNPTQLHRVAMNLLTNAVQAMPEGGGLQVQTRLQRLAEDFNASTGNLPAGDYLVLTVQDSGGGIDAEILPRIFDPFFSTKANGAGAGLGLSLVHGIVAEHLGAVEVESRAEGGCRFSVYLPRGDDRQATDVQLHVR